MPMYRSWRSVTCPLNHRHQHAPVPQHKENLSKPFESMVGMTKGMQKPVRWRAGHDPHKIKFFCQGTA